MRLKGSDVRMISLLLLLASAPSKAQARAGTALERQGEQGRPAAVDSSAGPTTVAGPTMSRAVNLVLKREARLASLVGSPILVASDVAVHLPRGLHRVASAQLGMQRLSKCKVARLLLVVVPGEVGQSPEGFPIVDLALESFGARCGLPAHPAFQFGTEWYRITFRGRRPTIRLTQSMNI
jgi:hypothetical protein